MNEKEAIEQNLMRSNWSPTATKLAKEIFLDVQADTGIEFKTGKVKAETWIPRWFVL